MQWTKFLRTPEELEVKDMADDEAIQKAKQEFDEIQKDEHERYLAHLRMKHILDTNSIHENGFEEGIEKGKIEKQKEIAKEMLKNNISVEIIIECTGLSEKEMEEIKDSN